jgi:hypothetical protein
MKKRTSTLTITNFLIGASLLFSMVNCQKEEFTIPEPGIKIFATVQDQPLDNQKSSIKTTKEDVQLIGQLFSSTWQLKESVYGLKSDPVTPTKSQVSDGDIIVVYGTGKTVLMDTEPLTNIDWTITGPPDTTINLSWTGVPAITYKVPVLGDYNVNPHLDGLFSWNMTIRVLGSPDELNIVNTEFVGSEWIPEDTIFRYTYKMEKPLFITTETLFRITELSSDSEAPYLPFLDGVYLNAAEDSIYISFDCSPSLEPYKVKFIAGYFNAAGDTIWFNANPASPYKCTEPVDADIFQATIYNGLEGVESAEFPLPVGVQPGIGDYNEDVPVVLMSLPTTGGVDLYLLSQGATTFRYKENQVDPWIEVVLTDLGGSRYFVNLPDNPLSGEHIFQYGTGTGVDFVPDEYMSLSSLYYTPYLSMVLVH